MNKKQGLRQHGKKHVPIYCEGLFCITKKPRRKLPLKGSISEGYLFLLYIIGTLSFYNKKPLIRVHNERSVYGFVFIVLHLLLADVHQTENCAQQEDVHTCDQKSNRNHQCEILGSEIAYTECH